MGTIWAAFSLLQALCLGVAHCSLPSIRGLNPSLAEQYRPQGDKFNCLDGEKIIMYSFINDDFCDCFDGSDEPGTSACVHGNFYCKNRGYTPQLLNASMVDDGFCDCCDGSDESSGKCSNTCAQAGAAARAELKAKAAREAAGAKVKEDYMKQAQEDKRRWQDEAQKVTQQIVQKQKLVDQWKVKKESVEAAEAKDRVRKEADQKAKDEATKKLNDAWSANLGKPDADVAAPDEPAGDHVTTTEPANAESGSADGAADEIINKAMGGREEAREEALSTSGDTQEEDNFLPVVEQTKDAIEGSIEEALKASRAATDSILDMPMDKADDASKSMNPHEAAKKEAEETSEERAKRIASQWIKDDSSAPEPSPAPTPEPQEEDQDITATSTGEELETPAPVQEEEPVTAEPGGFLAKARAAVSSVVSSLGFGLPGSDNVPSDGQKIKDTYWQYHNELTSLESRDTELKTQLSQDYGPNGEFLTLRDRCFTADVDKYVYEICLYGESAQKDGVSRTSLGSWKGFEENYSFMSFSGGQICWNGPQRSIKVAMQCGEKEHLQHVVEPSKCEYMAEFTTPAVCSTESAQKLQQQLLEEEEALQGAHDEL